MRIRRLVSLLAGLLLAAGSAAALDPPDDWLSGQHAYASGDYASALLYFESARDRGQQGPAVHYNIAVCQYKLGDYATASESFRLLGERFPRMRGLAEYNVGLAEQRLGNDRSAQQHFINAYRLSPDDEKLRSMSAALLREYGQRDQAAWYGSVGLRAGYDDNVALRDSLGLPAGVTSESPMVDLYAGIRGDLPGVSGVMLDANAYLLAYTDADDFDQSEFQLGGLYTRRQSGWRLEGALYLSYGTLGGSGFDRETTLALRASRPLDDRSTLDVRFAYDDVNSASAEFDGIAGSRQRLDLRYYRYAGDYRLLLRYGMEKNSRDDPGVSPARDRFGADFRYQPASGWGYEASLDYRNSDYDELPVPREENLLSASVALTRSVGIDWLFSVRYRYSNNESTDPDFSYRRNQLILGALRLF